MLTVCRAALEEGRPLRALELKGDDLKRLRGFQFLSAKPLLIVINLDESQLAAGGRTATDIERAAERRRADAVPFARGTAAVAVCAKIELEIAQLDAADAAAFLADLGLKESGLDRVIRASYDLLGYISFFTVGEDECRAWSIPRGTPAQLAAGEIHSDIARGFIRAEVVGYDPLITRGTMAACRDHGEVRLEGKEYVVQDGDIINFRFATYGFVEETRTQLLDDPITQLSNSTSVIVPAFNEAASIGALVGGLRSAATWGEILVVDDGSRDETGERARTAGARVIHHPYNKGNGAAVKTGIRNATGDFILIIDADGQHRPADALRLVAQLDTYDLVVGARSSGTQATAFRRVRQRDTELDGQLSDGAADS